MTAKSNPADLRRIHRWGIEDSRTGVSYLFTGNGRAAQREALLYCEETKAPVAVYLTGGGSDAPDGGWIREFLITP